MSTPIKALGIIRVSRLKSGAHSPEVQKRLIEPFAARQGWDLIELLDENEIRNGNVSGGADLSKRPGFGPAIQQVTRGEASVIVAADLSRLFRDIDIQREAIRQIELSGGEFWTVANGRVTHETAEAELMANFQGSVNHYQRRYSRDKSWLAVEVAIEQGKIPWSQTAPGYMRNRDSTLRVDPTLAPVIAEAFALRAHGSTIVQVAEFLAEHGIDRSYHGVQHLLRDRIYLGQIHFGNHTPNLNAHDAIVDPMVFRGVQRRKDPRGRRAQSDRLLARLGVLRCGTCDTAMTVGTQTQNGRKYPFYRCSTAGKGKGCRPITTISAAKVERAVVDAIQTAMNSLESEYVLADKASDNRRKAKLDLEDAQKQLDAAIELLRDFTDASARTRLKDLRQARDDVQARVDQLGPDRRPQITLTDDWDDLPLDQQRDHVRALIESVVVMPGRSEDRVVINFIE